MREMKCVNCTHYLSFEHGGPGCNLWNKIENPEENIFCPDVDDPIEFDDSDEN